MLDLNTKINIIDNARQILVGKVPNPITQVDLITTAMIYKFMDDMDLEATSLGGRRMFFVGKLKKYSWSNLLSATIGNNERLTLYTEALDKLPYAKQIPQLFRSIFRESSLPFKDARVLTLFLKEIDGLTYDNSETLGDAFEHLLAILGVQKDAGQFRTPRHIIDFIVEVVNPTKDDSILDPACGTAGFLISAYKHIIKTANEQKKPLSVDAIKRIAQNITGYDIDPTMQKLSLVNLYLHKFATPKVYEYDTLTKEDRWGDKFDVILANPPFMTPKGGIRPHNKFGIKANKSEVLFVDYFMEHLTLNGRAGFVVPEGIIFQSATAYKSLRKMMVEDNYLYAVVSLPAGVFNPYAGVKTSILFFDRQLAKKMDKILFVEVKNDGFDLGAQRRAIKENDLPSALQAIQEYQKSYNKKDLKLPDNCLLVEKSKIAENGDYNLTASRYRQTAQVINSKWEMVKLGDVCEFVRGVTYSKKDENPDGTVAVLRANNINLHTYQLDFTEVKYLDDSVQFDDAKKLYENDILICLASGSKEHIGKVAYIPKNLNMYFGGFMGVLRAKECANAKYLFYLLSNKVFNDYLNTQITGVNINNLNSKILSDFSFPLPPLEVQQEIVKELEGYQAIINGSQDVIDNWKPYFAIKPNWPKVKLGDVCEINPRTFEPIKEFGNTSCTYIDISSVENGTGVISQPNIIKCEEAPSRARREIKLNDVLLSTVRPNLKAFAIITKEYKNMVVSTGFAVLRAKENITDGKFLLYSIFQNYMIEQMVGNMGKGAYPSINQTDVENLDIYLPPLDEQKDIVNKIAREEQYIDICKEYIAHFKQKIADKIQTIWSSK